MVQVRSILWCAKTIYSTRTCMTRFGNTAGLPVPLYNPSGNRVNTLKNENHEWAGGSVAVAITG